MFDPEYINVVWGLGPIGASTALYLVASGKPVIGIDPKPETHGSMFDSSFIKRMTDTGSQETETTKLDFTPYLSVKDVPHDKFGTARIHFICVPTEKNGIPDMTIVETVLTKIFELEKDSHDINVLVESTSTPGFYDHVVKPLVSGKGGDYLEKFNYAHSPRRDWFGTKVAGALQIPRIIGANGESAKALFSAALSPIWTDLRWASSVEIAEMVKPTENAFRYVAILFAHQLSVAYPELDIDEVLNLAGTKWNMEKYYVSMGVGGYCIPLSIRYLVASPEYRGGLSIAEEAAHENERVVRRYWRFLADSGVKSIGLIGIRYRPMFSSAVESPVVRLAFLAKAEGMRVCAVDSFADVAEILGYECDLQNPDVCRQVDALIVHACETPLEKLTFQVLLARRPKILIDNQEGIDVHPISVPTGITLIRTKDGLPTNAIF
jgi:nucleotide sugar dehydrogenase